MKTGLDGWRPLSEQAAFSVLEALNRPLLHQLL
jgi:hypothetical protein